MTFNFELNLIISPCMNGPKKLRQAKKWLTISDRKLSVSVLVSVEISVFVSFNLSVSAKILVQNRTNNQRNFLTIITCNFYDCIQKKFHHIIFFQIKHFLFMSSVGLNFKNINCQPLCDWCEYSVWFLPPDESVCKMK